MNIRAVLWPSQTSSPRLCVILVSPFHRLPPLHSTQMPYRLSTRFCQYYSAHWLRLSHQLKSGASKPASCGFLSCFPNFSACKTQLGHLKKGTSWGSFLGDPEVEPRHLAFLYTPGDSVIWQIWKTLCSSSWEHPLYLDVGFLQSEVWACESACASLMSSHSSDHRSQRPWSVRDQGSKPQSSLQALKPFEK